MDDVIAGKKQIREKFLFLSGRNNLLHVYRDAAGHLRVLPALLKLACTVNKNFRINLLEVKL